MGLYHFPDKEGTEIIAETCVKQLIFAQSPIHIELVVWNGNESTDEEYLRLYNSAITHLLWTKAFKKKGGGHKFRGRGGSCRCPAEMTCVVPNTVFTWCNCQDFLELCPNSFQTPNPIGT